MVCVPHRDALLAENKKLKLDIQIWHEEYVEWDMQRQSLKAEVKRLREFIENEIKALQSAMRP